MIRLAAFTEHRLVTDGRTDIQTDGDSIYRASVASRGKKSPSAMLLRQMVAVKSATHVST